MITVISLDELKVLLNTGSLEKSQNTDFIKDQAMSGLILENMRSLLGIEPQKGFIAVLYGIQEDPSSDLFKSTTTKILRRLALPSEPIALMLPTSVPSIKIEKESLMDMIDAELDFADTDIKETISSLFSSSAPKDAFSYAFVEKILKGQVMRIMYPKNLEAQVESLLAKDRSMTVTFEATTMFQ